jgi:pimeloyl-ACP methyl ester carboxylesterase
MKEHAFLFGAHKSLVGIVTEPPGDAGASGVPPRLGFVFLNAGVIHRVGPSRLYVALARSLTELGCVSARFDHSGVGDSAVRRDGMPFEESAIAEAREAMDWLQGTRGVERFVLAGLCSGAVTSFEAAVADDRVVGVVMINPQGFDQSPEWNTYVLNRGRARRYLTRSLFSPRSWWNAVTGRVDYRRLTQVLLGQMAMSGDKTTQSVVSSVVSRVAADLTALEKRAVRTLLLCSEGDDGIEYMNVIFGGDVRRIAAESHTTVSILPGADHSLTLIDSQRRVVQSVREWAGSLNAAEVGIQRVVDDRAAARAPEAGLSASR